MDKRIMGLETEYGICSKWFSKDPEEFEGEVSSIFRIDSAKNGFLPNGGRCYLDCGSHPEYATPECTNPVDLVAYDKAGERFLHEHFGKYTLLKNNVAPSMDDEEDDVTFGCHENYMVEAKRYHDIVKEIVPFLVTRQIYTGSGAVRCGKLELSQRAAHINQITSGDSINNKPLILERDEPLACKRKYKRLQLLAGDSNMSEIATYLKTGITALVVRLIEEEHSPKICLKNPIFSMESISVDPKYRWLVPLECGKKTSAVNIQRKYLASAQRYFSGDDEITKDLLSRWEYVLDTLERKPLKLSRWLDWVAKRVLIDSFIRRHRSRYNEDELRTIDLRYHDINPERGLYYLLEREGQVDRLIGDKAIERAIESPPSDTRAWFRGKVIKAFAKEEDVSISCDWTRVNIGMKRFSILNPFTARPESLKKVLADFEAGKG